MIIQCHGCRQKYSIRDDKMRGRSARIRCRVCSESLLVSGGAPSVTPEANRPTDPFVNEEGAHSVSAENLIERVSSDTSRMPATLFENTAPMHDVRGIFPAEARTNPAKEPAPEPKSEPKSEAKPEPSPSRPDATPKSGARNSTSVLFSLADLARREQQVLKDTHPPSGNVFVPNAAPSVPAPSDDDAANENSGLIDLHRLMPNGSTLSPALVKTVSTSEPPLAVSRDVARPSRSSKRIALWALFGALLAVGALFAVRSLLPRIHPARQAVVAPAAPPLVAAAAEEPPKLEPLVPAPIESELAAATEASVTKALKPKSKRRHRGSRKHTTSSKSAPAEVAPAPSTDRCHCNGDLACAMRCAT